MALHAQDLLEPVGDLNPRALWPQYGEDEQDKVEEAIEAYLEQGYDRSVVITVSATLDESARQYARGRSIKQAYGRLILMPSSVATSDEGSASYTTAQIELLGAEAEAAFAAHEALIAAASPNAVAVVLNRASESHALGFTW